MTPPVILLPLGLALAVGSGVARARPLVLAETPPNPRRRRRRVGSRPTNAVTLIVAVLGAVAVINWPIEAVAAAACLAGASAARSGSRRRAAALAAQVASVDALTMLGICLSGGLGITESFAMLATLTPTTPWAAPSVALSRGAPLGEAMDHLPANMPALHRVGELLVTAHSDGGSVLDLIARQRRDLSDELATGRAERVQRLGVWMLLPLALCVLPALMVMLVVPIALDGAGQLNLPL